MKVRVFLLLLLLLTPLSLLGSFRRTVFFESFDSFDLGVTPTGWELWEGTTAEVSDARAYSPPKSLKVDSSTVVRRVGMEDADKLGILARVYPSSGPVLLGFARNDGTVKWIAYLKFDSGTATCGGKGSFSYSTSRWYQVEVILDLPSGRYWCYVDGEYVGLQVTPEPYTLEGLAIKSVGTSYFDDVEVYKIVPSSFLAEIWVDKGCGAVYKAGEPVDLRVRVNKDARVEVWEEFENGTTRLIASFNARANVEYSFNAILKESGYRRFVIKAWSNDAEYSENSCFIRVEEVPVKPIAIVRGENGRVSEKVYFDASKSYDPDGRVLEYYYDFGDGTTYGWTKESVVSHVYLEPGVYFVKVKVKDNDGLESDWSDPIKVVISPENRPPVASITSNLSRVRVGEKVYFDASKSYDPDRDELEYYYDFGDGTTYGWTALPLVKHSYRAPGNYTVKVKARDQEGLESDWATLTVHVINERPQAFIDEVAPSPAEEGKEVTLKGHGVDPDGGLIVKYEWRSNLDGYLGSSQELKAYLRPGVHEISFRVMDDEGTWSDWAKVRLEVKGQTQVKEVTVTQTKVIERKTVVEKGSGGEEKGGEGANSLLPLTLLITLLTALLVALAALLLRRASSSRP